MSEEEKAVQKGTAVNLGCATIPLFWTYIYFYGILISLLLMSSLLIAVEGRDNSCGYPPSFARSQNMGNGTLGDKEEGMFRALFSYTWFERVHADSYSLSIM